MTDILSYTLPLPPSVNHYYITTKQGKRIMTQEAKDWMVQAKWTIAIASKDQGWHSSEKEKLVMEINVFWPDNRRRDMNNLHKALCDAPEGIAYKDDKWVLVRDMDFAVDKANARVEIEIRKFDRSEI